MNQKQVTPVCYFFFFNIAKINVHAASQTLPAWLSNLVLPPPVPAQLPTKQKL